MITYSVGFESADGADRAAARLRRLGIAVKQFRTTGSRLQREESLVIGYPYSYPASISSPFETTSLLNGLPQTNGNAVMTPLFFYHELPTGAVRAEITVSDADAERARRALINVGGLELHMVQ